MTINIKPLLTIIAVDGETTTTPITKPPTFTQLQKAVGGMIEVVPYFDRFGTAPCVAFCNEEGKLKRLPRNDTATRHWIACAGPVADVLVGPVAVVIGTLAFLQRL